MTLVYELSAHITVGDITFLVPRSVAFIYCGFLFLLLFMGRYVMALLLAGARPREPPARRRCKQSRHLRRQLRAASALPLRFARRSHYRLIGFVDPDAA